MCGVAWNFVAFILLEPAGFLLFSNSYSKVDNIIGLSVQWCKSFFYRDPQRLLASVQRCKQLLFITKIFAPYAPILIGVAVLSIDKPFTSLLLLCHLLLPWINARAAKSCVRHEQILNRFEKGVRLSAKCSDLFKKWTQERIGHTNNVVFLLCHFWNVFPNSLYFSP